MRYRTAAALLAVIAVSACSHSDPAPSPSSSAPSSWSPPASSTLADHAADLQAAEDVVRKTDTLPLNGQVQADYIAPSLLSQLNDAHAVVAQRGAHVEGVSKVQKVTPLGYHQGKPDYASLHVCSVGDPRLIDRTGKDVTVRNDGVTPIPKGTRTFNYVYGLFKMRGQWQIATVMPTKTPC